MPGVVLKRGDFMNVVKLRTVQLVLKDYYPDIIPALKRHGFYSNSSPVSLEKRRIGSYTSVTVQWEKDQDYSITNLLATSISHYVVKELKEALVQDILYQNREILSFSEREKIFQEIAESGAVDIGNTSSSDIKSKIWGYLLEGHGYLNLEGFLRFRLIEYYRFLESNVYLTLGSFLKRQKQYAYVGMLKLHLSLREPRLEVAHLTADTEGQIYLSSEHPRDISSWKMIPLPIGEASAEMFEEELYQLLVNYAPRHLVLHRRVLFNYERIASILQGVFEERLTVCSGCFSCKASDPGSFFC